jgi:CubicO group peptidase (beta-lactamase class C family)
MKVTHTSTMNTTSSPWAWLRVALRWIGAVLGWATLMLATLLTGFISGWVMLVVTRLKSLPQDKVFYIWLVLLGITAGLAWLVARWITPARIVGWIVGSTLAVMLFIWVGWSWRYPDAALFLARDVGWGDANVKDYEKFPARDIGNSAPAFHFQENPSPDLFRTIEYRSGGELKHVGLEEFLQSTNTTSFIVIKSDDILYEGYFNGYTRDSIVTSFSVAKSFTSALIGIAIDEGYIGSVDDLMVTYLPELKGKGFDDLTIRHLLTMSSGIQYREDDEYPDLQEISQFTDDGLTYSYPDRRSLVLQMKPDRKPLGSEFNYNNYCTILLGMILERTTGQSPSEYLQEKIWEPLGMEYPASWSLERENGGLELIISGINARAVDFAKFGRLFLNNGNWNGAQIIPSDWVIESTAPDPNDRRLWHSYIEWEEANGYYKYQWWGRKNPDGSYHYTALGKRGQYIFVAPEENMVIVRFGIDEGGVDDWMSVFQGITAKVSAQTTNVQAGDWAIATPEEQGFDSAKMAEGLLAIQKNGTAIHNLTIVRNDKMILDADFYPYDGSIYHDVASITKSVMTTLIGIAADQGKLKLDDTMLSFFPDREIANRDERKERITVADLASMSSGLTCAADDEITMNEMRASQDWVQFALDRQTVRKPGTKFAYCSPDMHLLSAILQQATGMTTFDFAQKYLFQPLAIQDVYWPADPQGVTHGAGDLALHPQDMARLGSLFLHKGQWKGQQIVSSKWVDSALQPYHGGTGRIEDYGYGWWIGQPENEPEFLAAGNGGQKVKVYPRLNMIIVTTGGGFEFSEIQPYLVGAIPDLEHMYPLQPNPAGVAQMNAAVKAIARRPVAQPVPALPATATDISGQTFVFEENAFLRSFRLDFSDSAEAVLCLDALNEPEPRVIGIGLDGVYRSSHSGRPIIARGTWEDADTLVIDYNEGPGVAAYTFRLHFDGDQVLFEVPGVGDFRANHE